MSVTVCKIVPSNPSSSWSICLTVTRFVLSESLLQTHLYLSSIGGKPTTIADDTVTNNALGSSAGVRGHGAAGRAGGTAPTARSQASPFHGMGEAAKAASYGWSPSRDGGAGNARALCSCCRTARAASEHTAARRRVWPRRTFTITCPLSGQYCLTVSTWIFIRVHTLYSYTYLYALFMSAYLSY